MYLGLLTCGKLKASVDGHARALAVPGRHGEVQGTAVRVHAVGERELQPVASSDPVRGVDH